MVMENRNWRDDSPKPLHYETPPVVSVSIPCRIESEPGIKNLVVMCLSETVEIDDDLAFTNPFAMTPVAIDDGLELIIRSSMFTVPDGNFDYKGHTHFNHLTITSTDEIESVSKQVSDFLDGLTEEMLNLLGFDI